MTSAKFSFDPIPLLLIPNARILPSFSWLLTSFLDVPLRNTMQDRRINKTEQTKKETKMIFRHCLKIVRLAEKDVSKIRKFSTAPPSPLEGIRVLDMTRLVGHFRRYQVK